MASALIPQLLLNALVLALIYVLIASGFSLILSISRILNFAHGEIYMLGAFGCYFLYQVAGLNFFLALLITAIIIGALGVGLERLFFKPCRGNDFAMVIMSLGLTIFISGAALAVFGEKDRGVSSPFAGVIKISGVTFSIERLVIILVSIAIFVGLYYFIKRVKIGQAMRAVAENSEAARLQGISIDRVCALSFGIGCALAAAAGVLTAPLYYVNPFLGPGAILPAIIVVILGGLGSISGVVAGSLILGFIQSFGGAYIGGYSGLIAYCAVIILLTVKPQGLFGHE